MRRPVARMRAVLRVRGDIGLRGGRPGAAGLDAERVDVGFHQIADGIVDEAVTLQRPEAGEASGDDPHVEMPAAVFRACVSDMLVALVDDLEVGRLQRRVNACPDLGDAGVVHGRTFLKGLTSTFSYTPAATYGSVAAH